MSALDEECAEIIFNRKPFNKLLPGEKTQVLKFMSEDEYSEYLGVVEKFKDAIIKDCDNLSIKDSVQKNIKKAFKNKHHNDLSFQSSLGVFQISTNAFRKGIVIGSACCLIFISINYLNSGSGNETLVARKTEVVEMNRQKKTNEGTAEAERIKNTMFKDTTAADKTYPIRDEDPDSKSLAYDLVLPEDQDTFNYTDMNPPGLIERPLVPHYN